MESTTQCIWQVTKDEAIISLLTVYCICYKKEIIEHVVLTPFLPGIAHSQFNKFNVPSGFLVGLATKPYNAEYLPVNLFLQREDV